MFKVGDKVLLHTWAAYKPFKRLHLGVVIGETDKNYIIRRQSTPDKSRIRYHKTKGSIVGDKQVHKITAFDEKVWGDYIYAGKVCRYRYLANLVFGESITSRLSEDELVKFGNTIDEVKHKYER